MYLNVKQYKPRLIKLINLIKDMKRQWDQFQTGQNVYERTVLRTVIYKFIKRVKKKFIPQPFMIVKLNMTKREDEWLFLITFSKSLYKVSFPNVFELYIKSS